MYNPVATYRLQFHKDFGLNDLERIIPYLKKLGIGTVYASPIFEATPGSMHGYDGADMQRINPEIGTEEQLRKIAKELKADGIGWMQDIVPNHMAYHHSNKWLMDMLEKGQASPYATFFDTAWTGGDKDVKLMVPFLGKHAEEAIHDGELKVAYKDGRFVFEYFDALFPLRLNCYEYILRGKDMPDDVWRAVVHIQSAEDAVKQDNIKQQIAAAFTKSEHQTYLQQQLDAINGDAQKLTNILNAQYYRLCHWQETDAQINYRRFFTVNGLICLNVQDEKVFGEVHSKVKELLDAGVFQGLRIDHIDGLYDPISYLADLRQLAGEETCVTVEKILQQNEQLPGNALIQGNTGYDFLAVVNNLFTNADSKKAFNRFYKTLTGGDVDVQEQIREKKELILYRHMAGELDNLYSLLANQELVSADKLDAIGDKAMKSAIGAFLIECPVYRFYGNSMPLAGDEEKQVKQILKHIKKTKPQLEDAVDILQQVLIDRTGNDAAYADKARHFYQRCMQLSGPLMAKGVEDTLMYTYNRFVGHNDVGDAPEAFGMSIKDFHSYMQERAKHWPMSINATATHDTKRGEDVRARLNVLTDMPDKWIQAVEKWQKQNKELKTANMPDANDEYFIYQTLAGAFPFEEEATLAERLEEYIRKALREGKTNSDWGQPNEAYEQAAISFVHGLLDKSRPFYKDFIGFVDAIKDHGIVNSLSQLVLKFTTPGIPDTYQGTELWDLSLVDPDNRRPVDYDKRMQMLDALHEREKDDKRLKTLWQERNSGKIKLWLTHALLQERKHSPSLFTHGQYRPLKIKGKYKDHVLAFLRQYKNEWCLVAIPKGTAQLMQDDPTKIDWKDTNIVLPEDTPNEWKCAITKKGSVVEDAIAVSDLFSDLPFAILKSETAATERGAGILLSITSLPSGYGVGDMGPEAYRFADFLYESRQKYWQILPLNPAGEDSGYSPYSSISSMAGNVLLISPDKLVEEGLLDDSELPSLPSEAFADYKAAEKHKCKLFDKAYERFVSGNSKALRQKFDAFCKEQQHWLDDYTLFVVLRQQLDNKPWYEWPEEYKTRNAIALDAFRKANEAEISKQAWLQFIFLQQWKGLKAYCNDRDIKMFGDLPFYVSYNSADVWAHPEIFMLDEQLNITGVAGVPPDYFSADGQLWGMPTFRWDVLKKNNYEWWISRLKHNLELYDLLRIDHFRAMAEYWEVPAGEKTAINGEWKEGPGKAFFDVLAKELGRLPFVAEDLGDNLDKVYALRDELGLPGMKVLQFAFGGHMPYSVDIPHNYTANCIVYTGTHDNTTTLGWYEHESNKADHKRMEHYIDARLKAKDVHCVMARMAYASVAKTAIMPMQDILGLPEKYRMNTPGLGEGNWLWRLTHGQLTDKITAMLRQWVKTYNR